MGSSSFLPPGPEALSRDNSCPRSRKIGAARPADGASLRAMKPLVLCLFLGAACGVVRADDPPAYEPTRFFRTQILPILERRRYECHSEAEGQDDGGLVLDSRAGWTRGGDHGPAVIPKDLAKSHLIRSIRSDDPGTRMPPEDPLPPLEVALLQTWVLLGAPDPRE